MTDILHITDRERAKDALILQLSEGRDKLAARVEALEAELRLIVAQDNVDLMLDPQWAKRIAEAALTENQT